LEATVRVRIAKRYTFQAAHYLPHVADGHKCKRLHGHSYALEIICEGEPDERGMVIDYFEIDEAWAPIYATIDHRLLNELDGFENPTTENVSRVIFDTLKMSIPCLVRVRLSETHDEWGEYPA
jgi:6-pyruvoyltetrahydropterin/6-carboxytetrahydropterin synthase